MAYKQIIACPKIRKRSKSCYNRQSGLVKILLPGFYIHPATLAEMEIRMTQEHITKEIFEKLVDLAAIALDQTQSEYLRSELNNQLTAIHELNAIPLDESTPMALHGISYTDVDKPPLREDKWVPYGNEDAIIAQAPVSEDRYIVVPEIPHEGME